MGRGQFKPPGIEVYFGAESWEQYWKFEDRPQAEEFLSTLNRAKLTRDNEPATEGWICDTLSGKTELLHPTDYFEKLTFGRVNDGVSENHARDSGKEGGGDQADHRSLSFGRG